MCDKRVTTDAAAAEHNAPYKYCLNCNAELQGHYCHVCGQHASGAKPTIKEFILEYLNNAFLWDVHFFRTLWALISRPGMLTKEFLAGRVVSYTHPLKLNMFLLFVFITMFLFFSSGDKINDSMNEIASDKRILIGVSIEQLLQTPEEVEALKSSPRDTVLLHVPLFISTEYSQFITHIETFEDTKGEGLDKWRGVVPRKLIEDEVLTLNAEGYYHCDPKEGEALQNLTLFRDLLVKLMELLTEYFPMLVLFTAPILSLSLSLVRRSMRRPHFDHFIFALHYTAFIELVIIVIYLLHLISAPNTTLLELLLTVGSCLYLTVAFRRVDGIKSWFKAFGKALFTSLTYLMICVAILCVILIIACFAIADVAVVE